MSFQVKTFTLRVVEITTTSPLPSGTVGTPYSKALAATGTTGTVLWDLVSSTLPDGLTLSTSGVISGTPLTAQSTSFTVELLDGGGATCEKMFSLEIVSVVALEAYWAYESIAGNILQDSTSNNVDLSTGGGGALIAGVVDNGYAKAGPSSVENLAIPAAMRDISSGITVCGWIKADFTESTSVANILHIRWGTNDLLVEFDGTGTYHGNLQVGVDSIDVNVPTIDDNDWHFYRLWYDSSDGQLRLQIDNGTINASGFTITPPAAFPSGSIEINGGIASAPGNTRSYDETGVWMRALTNTEASNVYNSGFGITFGNPLMPP